MVWSQELFSPYFQRLQISWGLWIPKSVFFFLISTEFRFSVFSVITTTSEPYLLPSSMLIHIFCGPEISRNVCSNYVGSKQALSECVRHFLSWGKCVFYSVGGCWYVCSYTFVANFLEQMSSMWILPINLRKP